MKQGLLLLMLWAVAAVQAAEVGPCGDLNRIDFLAGNPRTFANGSIRVAAVDTYGEPVCCSYHLLVFIPEQEIGSQCFAVSQESASSEAGSARGFFSLNVEGIQANYDPERGLLLKVPYSLYEESGKGVPGTALVRINQKGSGSVTVERAR